MSQKVKQGVFWVSLSAYIILVFAFPESAALRSSGLLVVAVPSLLAQLLFLAFHRAELPKERRVGEYVYAAFLLAVGLAGAWRLAAGGTA